MRAGSNSFRHGCSVLKQHRPNNLPPLQPVDGKRHFSTPLKQSRVLKKTTLNPDDASSYRPISNLHYLSKFIDRVVANLSSEHLLPVQQCSQHSSLSILLKLLLCQFRWLCSVHWNRLSSFCWNSARPSMLLTTTYFSQYYPTVFCVQHSVVDFVLPTYALFRSVSLYQCPPRRPALLHYCRKTM